MLFKKQGFPEENDLVLCTVTSVQFHSVFVNIEDYGRSGMIHISEISPGRIRNIRDFVKEGKKIVCKVLRINKEKGYIDLSLRRVNSSEKRRKIEGIKKEQNAEKIVDVVAKGLGIKTEQLHKEITEKISGQFAEIHNLFEHAVMEPKILEDIGLDKKHAKALDEIVKDRMKPAEVKIRGKLKIKTYAINGIDIIKDSLKKAEEAGKGRIVINYLGSGTYHFMVTAPDYKEAEKYLKDSTESAIQIVKKTDGIAEFTRDTK
jgi:translation initiation factor 2 subunit 1